MTLRTMKRQAWIGIFTVIMTAVSGDGFLAAEETTEQRIASLEAKAGTVSSLQADMSMAMDMMGKNMVSNGTVYFKKPRMSLVETETDMGTMKMKQIMVSDGETVWTYQPSMKMAVRIDLKRVIAAAGDESAGDRTGGDVTKPFNGFERETISFIRNDKLDEKDVYVFQGVPGKKNMEKMPVRVTKIETWVGADDGLVRKAILFGEDGKEIMSQTYSNIRINVEIDNSLFVFTPPEGAQVMDMTEGTINMMKEMKGEKEK